MLAYMAYVSNFNLAFNIPCVWTKLVTKLFISKEKS